MIAMGAVRAGGLEEQELDFQGAERGEREALLVLSQWVGRGKDEDGRRCVPWRSPAISTWLRSSDHYVDVLFIKGDNAKHGETEHSIGCKVPHITHWLLK